MSWPTVALGDVANVNWGDTSVTKKSYTKEGFTAYSATGADGKLPYFDFDREGVVLSAIGARCGKTWFASGKWSTIKNTIRFWSERPDLDNRFLYWLTANPEFWPRRGAAQPFITIGDARSLKIPLPPLEEQKRIAQILDQADALRRLRTRALDKLNTLGQAIFHEMFGDATIEGKNWPKYALGELVADADRINYGVVQPGDHDPEGVPIIRVADLNTPLIDFRTVKRIAKDIDSNYARSRLKGGEILIGCVGSIGTAMIAPDEFKGANIARAVARVSVDPNKCDPEFVAEYIRSDAVQRYFQKEVRLVAQPTLNIKQIRETEIVVPPTELQAKFLERLNVIKESKKVASKSFVAQNTLFASLQHRAFRGEL